MEFREPQAIYLQIADLVCEHIILKKWPVGGKILSVRDLAVELEVNPNTVMRTYDMLQGMDIIYNKRGIGFFVADDAVEKVITYRRNLLLKNELPQLFKNMLLLNIGMDELHTHFETYKQNFDKLK